MLQGAQGEVHIDQEIRAWFLLQLNLDFADRSVALDGGIDEAAQDAALAMPVASTSVSALAQRMVFLISLFMFGPRC